MSALRLSIAAGLEDENASGAGGDGLFQVSESAFKFRPVYKYICFYLRVVAITRINRSRSR